MCLAHHAGPCHTPASLPVLADHVVQVGPLGGRTQTLRLGPGPPSVTQTPRARGGAEPRKGAPLLKGLCMCQDPWGPSMACENPVRSAQT